MNTRCLTAFLLGFLLESPVFGDSNAALAAALADVRGLPADVQKQARYLYLGNLPAPERESAVRVLAFQTNSLSRQPDLVAPHVVNAEVLRVLLSDYGWKAEVWEKLAGIDPYFHVQVEVEEIERWGVRDRNGILRETEQRRTGKKIRQSLPAPWLEPKSYAALNVLTGSETSVVRADWWFTQTARQLSLTNQQTGAGYYEWLGLATLKDFEKLIRLDKAASIEVGKETRAAVEHSGVSAQNRQIDRFQSLAGGGYAWTTEDTDNSTDAGNAIRNLKRGTYKAKAQEHIASLPNGLVVTFLNAVGGENERQTNAPDFIGIDDSPLRSGRDARIHVHLSCISCHGPHSMLQPIDDWVRRFQKTISSPSYAELQELRRQFFSNLNRQLAKDRLTYIEALAETNGWTPSENAKHFVGFWHKYADDVSVDQVAVELETTPAMLRKTFQTSPDPILATLGAEKPGKLPRVYIEEIYPVARIALMKK